ncbi:MAG: hypothetical protein IKQ40_03245 [Lachnospiraceae bacterium]|nr:hypothetical protein [Lachnospiraceae bacterium]
MSEMNVGSVSNVYTPASTSYAGAADAPAAASNAAGPDAVNVAAVYEKSSAPDNKATYSINKMSAEDRAALVQQLKQDQLDRQNQLADIVRKMFSDQAGVSKLSELFSPENLKDVSQADIDKAKEDISEDGYWGIKQTSQRLFDFASALAGDDPEKMKEMQAAMEKGFKEATGAWGDELPEICKETLSAANKMFDEYYASKG